VPTESALSDSDIDDSDQDIAYFTPDAEGTYTLTLTVDDGTDTDSDTVTVDLDQGGVVLAMFFDEGTGDTTEDSSGRGHVGDVTSAGWTSGYMGSGMGFGGSTYVEVEDSDTELSFATDYTIEWWMKTRSTGHYYDTVFYKPDSSGVYGYAVWLYYGRILFYGYESVSDYTYHSSADDAYTDDDQWHHYAMVMDSSEGWTLYIDGEENATDADSTTYIEANESLYVGAYTYGTSYFLDDASLDEVLIRNKAMTASEVQDRFEAGSQWCTGWEDDTDPVVSIDSPSNGATVDGAYFIVTGTASDDSDVSEVTLTAGGNSVEVSSDDGYATWSAYVGVLDGPGSYLMIATATDLFGNSGSHNITITSSDSCTDGLNALYLFDEYEGSTVEDRTDNALDLRAVSVDRVATVELGNVGRFDGSASYAYVEDDALLEPGDEFTLDLWFMRDGASPDWEAMVNKGYNWGTYSVWVDGLTLYASMTDSAGSSNYVEASGYFDGDYHHLTMVYDGYDLTLYLDGGEIGTVEIGTDLWDDDQDLRIGNADYWNAYHFEGDVDQLRIHDTALSSGEVLDLTDESEACQISENYAADGSASANTELSTAYGGHNVNDESVAEDGTAYSYWLTAVGTNGYAQVILDDPIGLSEVRFLNTHNGTATWGCAYAEYSIYASATGEFTGEEVLLDEGDGELEETLSWKTVTLDEPVEAQFVRFVSEDYEGYCGGLNELEIYGLE